MEPSEIAITEITVVEHTPITAKITTTIGHLQRIGGFRARWRGAGLSLLYHLSHGFFINVLAAFLGIGLAGEVVSSVIVSVGLSRLHMAWTHSMIAHPSATPWYRRMPSRKDSKAILLPAVSYALAQEASMILPFGVALALGVAGPESHALHEAASHCPKQMLLMGLRVLAVVSTYAFVGLAVLFPASVPLTRVEAMLLPETESTIVPFDKAAVLGDADISVRGGCRAIHLQAWRSFDGESRWRLIKLYAKMIMIQLTIAFIAVHLMVAELYVLGSERMAILFRSIKAQWKLSMIEAHEQVPHGHHGFHGHHGPHGHHGHFGPPAFEGAQ